MKTEEYREYHREYSRNYYQKNKKSIQECKKNYSRIYRQLHPDRIKATRIKYKEKYPEKIAKRRKGYREKYPEKIKEYRRKYRIEHRGKYREYNKKYRCKLLENGGKNGSLTQRWKVLQRDNFTCQYCGRKAPDVALQVDHKIPKSLGGKYNLENLITSCFECNQGKKDTLLNN